MKDQYDPTPTTNFVVVAHDLRIHDSATSHDIRDYLVVMFRSLSLPLASMSLSSLNAKTRPTLVFDLARSVGVGDPSARPAEALYSTSSSELPSTELDESTEEELTRVKCPLCRRALVPRRGVFARRAAQVDPTDLLVCDGCQQCFHRRCCQRRGLSTARYHKGPWFHSEACHHVYDKLHELVEKGEGPVTESTSFQLLYCPKACQPRNVEYPKFEQVVRVLMPEYGPFVPQHLEGSQYAVLLKHEGAPVTAAIMDVFGKTAASVDLVATSDAVRLRGHCRSMMEHLEKVLDDVGVDQMLVMCDPFDENIQDMWMTKFDYQPCSRRQRRHLQSQFVHLSHQNESLFFYKTLPTAQAARRKWWRRLNPFRWS